MGEYYIVKDLVQMTNLELGEPHLDFDLKFPSMVKPVVQSKSDREFAGRLREVVKWDYEKVETFVQLDFNLGGKDKEIKYLDGNLNFNLIRSIEEEEGGGLGQVFGEDNYNILMSLSFCHLVTENTPISSQELLSLEKDMEKSDYFLFEITSDDSEDIEEIYKLWDLDTGFLYAKLTVVLILNEDGVRKVMMNEGPGEDFSEIGGMTRKMLEEEICTDLEIRCGDGGIVRCHRAVLGGRSEVFKNMFEAEEMEEARTGKLGMEEMSEQGVRAFLRRNCPEKLVESEDYQELIKNDPETALDLTLNN